MFKINNRYLYIYTYTSTYVYTVYNNITTGHRIKIISHSKISKLPQGPKRRIPFSYFLRAWLRSGEPSWRNPEVFEANFKKRWISATKSIEIPRHRHVVIHLWMGHASMGILVVIYIYIYIYIQYIYIYIQHHPTMPALSWSEREGTRVLTIPIIRYIYITHYIKKSNQILGYLSLSKTRLLWTSCLSFVPQLGQVISFLLPDPKKKKDSLVVFTILKNHGVRQWEGLSHTHRIHGAAIYGNMDPINISPMLEHIPAPWILWDIWNGNVWNHQELTSAFQANRLRSQMSVEISTAAWSLRALAWAHVKRNNWGAVFVVMTVK